MFCYSAGSYWNTIYGYYTVTSFGLSLLIVSVFSKCYFEVKFPMVTFVRGPDMSQDDCFTSPPKDDLRETTYQVESSRQVVSNN